MSTTYATPEQRREGIRVPVEEGKGVFGRLIGWYSRRTYGEDGFVELTMIVAVENERSRFNSAAGLTSQGFKAQCELRR